MKLHPVDLEALRVIAATVQKSSGSPFVKPTNAIREALRIAREKIVSAGMKQAREQSDVRSSAATAKAGPGK